MGSGRGRARQGPRSTNAEDRNRVTTFRIPTVPTEQLRRECNTREQGHQGNYFTDSPRLRPPVDEERRVADRANRYAKRVAKFGVKGRNVNANEDEGNQKGIHNPSEGRPEAPERGRR